MNASRLTSDVRMLHEQLSDCLEQWESFMPKPQHSDLIEVWKNEKIDFLDREYTYFPTFSAINLTVNEVYNGKKLFLTHTRP